MTPKFVDINKSSKREILSLKGIGPVLAERIIINRPYYAVEDLLQISGIKEKKLFGFQDQLLPIEVNGSFFSEKENENFGKKFPNDEEKNAFSADTRKQLPPSLLHPIQTPSQVRSSLRFRSSVGNGAVLVASWNVRNISKSKKMAHLQQICRIIQEYDVVALQEIRDLIVLKRMRVIMPGWDFVASPEVGKSQNHDCSSRRSERYAFFFRKDKIRVIGRPGLMPNPSKLASSCPACKEKNVSIFARQPYVGCFGYTNENTAEDLNFILINVHLATQSALGTHKEANELALVVRSALNRPELNEKNILILGDFNLTPLQIGKFKGMFPLFRSPLSSTIYNNLYDNIFIRFNSYQKEYHKNEWKAYECGIHRIDWQYYKKKSVQFKTKSQFKSQEATVCRNQCNAELSDHCPIWVAFYCE